jgi:UPF0755 protein
MAAKKKSGIFVWILLIIVAIGAFAAFKIFGPNTGDLHTGEYLYIKTGSTYADVKTNLKQNGFVSDIPSFDMLAQKAGYPNRVFAGRYKISRGMSNYNMVRMLRSGRQEPVKLVINKLRTQKDFIRFVCTRLEADSVELEKLLQDPAVLSDYNLDANTAMCAVIPDTYEFFWNTSAEKAFKKIAANYVRFWDGARKQKAIAMGLTPAKAVTIASIVDEETNKNDEKPNVASVYINRLKKGMKLEADPTVKFALNDFSIKRITGIHLQHVSPYNTYMFAGLPPGPICTPSKASIDAVLNASNTDYIFFCAKEDFSGYHRFASNYADHLKNAKLYQQALDARGIK